MARISGLTQRLVANRRGATAVEYGLIVALVVIVVIGAVMAVAGASSEKWNYVERRVTEGR